MSVKLTIGLCRKIGEPNNGSRRASVNLEMALDIDLIADATKFQEHIRRLFAVVRGSVDDELDGGNRPGASRIGSDNQLQNRWSVNRPATPSQVKAIIVIAKGKRLNLAQILQDRFQVKRADKLTLRQASQLIGELNAMQKAEEE